ncbi:alpha/beta-hydrolase [Schizophyllum commune H4-8]|uniref:Carboxylic ester hydrolase n=1 Tax=Schizophyllum commune (strain H4-8 / FGSC 9210) TaxID=578458 RepID=D8QFS6_SCHCM|nr:alpha/beta-hydrolase [Schizophyllum commune H4-8]KAI5887766.1 alpha/beta-hydrolase [Schizophyllum commune H4-8]
MRALHLSACAALVLFCIPCVFASPSDADLGLDAHLAVVSANTTADEVADASGAGPLVDLGYAKYEGVADESTGTTRFLGMRYAVPPIGSLRFRAPVAPLPDPGAPTLKADSYPPMCACGEMGFAPEERPPATQSEQSEDCLFLNVFVPGNLTSSSSASPKPVLVWIHGGGYHTGSSSGYPGGEPYSGDDLIRAAKGEIVVVTIQYRLGVLGFLAGKEVKEDGVLNAGLLDQQLALRWVQEHISKFGGDPSDVTIWGQSAGAGSVLHHVIANGGKTEPPLFRKAMLSSLFIPPEYAYDDEVPESIYHSLLNRIGCNSLQCLREVDFETLREVNYDLTTGAFYGTFVMAPVVDGDFVRRAPLEAVARREVNVHEVLAMVNTDEGGIFVTPKTAGMPLDEYITTLFPKMGVEEAKKGAALYEGLGSSTRLQQMVMGEAIFVCPNYNIGKGFDTVYRGTLATPPGAHGQDINLFFRSLDQVLVYFPWSPPSAEFADAFADMFISYVLTGKPRRHLLDARGLWSTIKTAAEGVLGAVNKVTGLSLQVPSFLETTSVPVWAAENPREVLFNVTEAGVPYVAEGETDAALLERCAFWWDVRGWTHQ